MCDLVCQHVSEDERRVDGGAMSGPLDAVEKDPHGRRSLEGGRRSPESNGRYPRGTARVRPQNDDRDAKRIRSEPVKPFSAWNDHHLDANPLERATQLALRRS